MRRSLVALICATLLTSLLSTVASASAPPLPGSIAAVGDSITQAVSTEQLGVESPQNSWATGTNATVNSHYLRLLGLNAPIAGRAFNLSMSGAKMADLNGQMQQATGLQPDYLTVLIGGNDLCTPTEAQMTSVTDFRAQFELAMGTLSAGSPGTHVFVASIPRVNALWELFRGNWWARFIWSFANICQSLLENPTSTQTADVQRRERVAQRNVDFNQVLLEVCSATPNCRWDGWAVYNTQYVASDAAGDYFHPSTQGQAKLAAVTWAAGYWADGAPPPANQDPIASFSYSCIDLACTFDGNESSDPDGSLVSYAWTFGADGSATGATPSHEFSAAGSYTVTLSVTDDDGATGSTAQSVTVTAPQPTGTMSIGALDASSATRKGGWTATVTIGVVDGGGAAVAGATVSGSWSSGGSGSCTTSAAGTCSVSSNANKKTTSVTWTVLDVAHPTLVYDPSANLVSSVTLSKP